MSQAIRLKELRLLALVGMAMLAVCKVAAAGTTLVFAYPDGFAGSSGTIHLAWGATLSGSSILLTDAAHAPHQANAAYYVTQQSVGSFTTDFTFQMPSGQAAPSLNGITFVIQNTTSATNPMAFGLNASEDANLCGFGGYWNAAGNEGPLANSVAIKFDMNNENQGSGSSGNVYPDGKFPNSIGLYLNGGPSAALTPQDDINYSGINFYNGNIMAAHVVYDGSLLTLVLRDTKTNAQLRKSWPVNIPAVTKGSAWVGFTGGTVPAVNQSLLTWSFWQGYNPRLAAPTFSVAAGSYASAQSVSISASPGATIYYTTNGQQPTTSSPQYTGPISVSASEVVQAIAVQTGSEDSLVAVANYQIAPANTPLINFPSGFVSASNLVTVNGASQFSGSALQLTNTAHPMEVGTAWYVVPVNVASFTTNFTLQFPNSSGASGVTFTIQNQPPASSDTSIQYVTGGPNTMANNQSGLGYSGSTGGVAGQISGILSSVAVKFDLFTGTTGLYTNGVDVSQNGISPSASGLNLHSGNPFAVALSYDGTTLSMTITDTVTHASYSHSWAINIPATVGGSSAAYVGFTGSTGYAAAAQNISAWTYSTQGQTSGQAPAVPMPPTNLTVH